MIEIQLDKPRKVEFTMRAFRAFKIDTGHSILMKGFDNKNINEESMVDLVYAGLIGGDKDMELSKEDVAGYLDFAMFNRVLTEMAGGVNKLVDTGDEKK